ncbi:hypothetical protein F183_A30140 [Bryobacterales bacterium F-183]|nr:hypothetical protein F183_A30140 [Bryobacterales bacterium F-183]
MKLTYAFWALLAPLYAQEYFPIQPGNEWVFRGSRFEQTRVISVGESATFDGQTYYAVTGVTPERHWLRNPGDGSVVEYDTNTMTARPFLSLQYGEGQSFPVQLPPCNQQAVIATKGRGLVTPAGDFANTVEVRYPNPSCADAGIEQEFFAANVGPVKRVETSFAGPVTYELAYAKVGGVLTLTSKSESSFGIGVVPPAATGDGALFVRLTLKNAGPEPVILNYRSGQEYDFRVRNAAGEVIYVWSSTRLFPAVIQTIRVEKEKTWATSFTVPGGLRPGKYSIEGYLTTVEPQNFVARTEFQVPEVSTAAEKE